MASPLTHKDCWRILGQNGLTVWFTGDAALADAVGDLLIERGLISHRLLHDDVHSTGRVAKLLAGAGVIALVSCDQERPIDRRRARELHNRAGIGFLDVPDAASYMPEEVVAQIARLARPDARAA